MKNAYKFREVFGLYATELWAMSEKDFLEWLNAEADTPQRKRNRRTIVIEAETDSDNSFETIKGDVETELSCCFTPFDTMKVYEQADTPQTEDLLITEYPQEGEVNIVGNGSRTAVVMDYDEYKAMQTESESDCPWK